MSIYMTAGGTIVMEGACLSEDAETLLQLLQSAPKAIVDWRLCSAAHSAVIQVLMVAGPSMLGPPAGAALARWAAQIIAAAGSK